MKLTLELVLAILSGLCGLIATVMILTGHDRAAGVAGGVGLFLCNVVWVLRLT